MRSRSMKPVGTPTSPLPGLSSSISSVSGEDARERHEAAPDRLLAEREHRLLGAAERGRRVDAAVEAVGGDPPAGVDQPAADRALLDDLDVGLEAAEVGQVDVEAGQVGEAAGRARARRAARAAPAACAGRSARPRPAARASRRRAAGGGRRRSPRASAGRRRSAAAADRAAPRRAPRAPIPRSAAGSWASGGRRASSDWARAEGDTQRGPSDHRFPSRPPSLPDRAAIRPAPGRVLSPSPGFRHGVPRDL